MRTSVATLATAVLFAATGAFAQQAPSTPVRTESAFSPFVYEALGATPSIRLHKAPAAPAEAKAPVKENTPAAGRTQDAANATAAKVSTAPAQATAPAAATTH